MQASVESFIRYMLDCFTKGRFREFVERVAIPMVIYADEPRIVIARHPQEAALFLAAGWFDLCGRVDRCEPEIVSIGAVRNGEFAARVDWHFFDAEGRETDVSRVRYVLGHDEKGQLRLELTEVFGPSWVRPVEVAPLRRVH